MRRSLRSDLLLVALSAIVGAYTCFMFNQPFCYAVDTQLHGRPAVGTPRATYCHAISHWSRWIWFPALAAGLALVSSRLLARTARARFWALMVVVTVAIADVVVVARLPAVFPGP
jgi:hypothetical protein